MDFQRWFSNYFFKQFFILLNWLPAASETMLVIPHHFQDQTRKVLEGDAVVLLLESHVELGICAVQDVVLVQGHQPESERWTTLQWYAFIASTRQSDRGWLVPNG